MSPTEQFVDIGIKLHVREWAGAKQPFVLLHGLSSNSLTWNGVAARLAEAGHQVVAVDQRGHGLSDKPDIGYDFASITGDLSRLLVEMELERPILVGQSWGGNVLLEFGARYPDFACGLGFVDGGFLDMQSRPDATWEKISVELKPPNLNGMPRAELKQRMMAGHPDWVEAGVEATLGNFETLPDGTVRPWLSLDRHMEILRAMWDQRPPSLYPNVSAPTLICVAASSKTADWTSVKAKQVAVARAGLPWSAVHWFDETDHDIHVHRPDELAELFLETLENGIWHNGCKS